MKLTQFYQALTLRPLIASPRKSSISDIGTSTSEQAQACVGYQVKNDVTVPDASLRTCAKAIAFTYSMHKPRSACATSWLLPVVV